MNTSTPTLPPVPPGATKTPTFPPVSITIVSIVEEDDFANSMFLIIIVVSVLLLLLFGVYCYRYQTYKPDREMYVLDQKTLSKAKFQKKVQERPNL